MKCQSKGKVQVVYFRARGGGPPWPVILNPRYLEEFMELSKILPDLEFSDICCIEVSRVLAESFSSRRNRYSKLKT